VTTANRDAADDGLLLPCLMALWTAASLAAAVVLFRRREA
jgi:hypothetical protein